jgi:hypothetical protein
MARSVSTTPSTTPRIGVISGAMIMAPITVAVESLTTSAVAITADSSSKSQKRFRRRLRSGPSKKTWSRICLMSTWVTVVTTVVPPASSVRPTARNDEYLVDSQKARPLNDRALGCRLPMAIAVTAIAIAAGWWHGLLGDGACQIRVGAAYVISGMTAVVAVYAADAKSAKGATAGTGLSIVC